MMVGEIMSNVVAPNWPHHRSTGRKVQQASITIIINSVNHSIRTQLGNLLVLSAKALNAGAGFTAFARIISQ